MFSTIIVALFILFLVALLIGAIVLFRNRDKLTDQDKNKK